MERAKMLGLIIGIVGLIILLWPIAFTVLASAYYIPHDIQFFGYVRQGDYYDLGSAILFGIAFAFGAAAIILFRNRRRVYSMLLSTIIGALGFAPQTVEFSVSGFGNQLLVTTVLAFVTVFLLFISTILFSISTKQQKKNSLSGREDKTLPFPARTHS